MARMYCSYHKSGLTVVSRVVKKTTYMMTTKDPLHLKIKMDNETNLSTSQITSLFLLRTYVCT